MSTVPTTEPPRPEPPARPEPLYVKLRPGPGPDHDAVASNQRSRLIGAMIEEVAEHGYAGATLARLVALAGVSKRAFHELFGTKQAYFLATYDAIVANAVRRIGVAYRSEGDWQARLRAGFAAYAAEVMEEPKAARLVLVEVLGAGSAALARMRRTRLIFEEMVSASFREAPDGVTLPPLIAKGIVCGVERITRQRLLAGDVDELPALADELLAWALSYCSPAVAGLAAALPAQCDGLAPCCPGARGESDWARILRCAAEIAATKGYAQLSPARIARDAGVTEARFDELFESTEQCFLDALDRLGLEALVCATRASQGSEEPLAGVHGAIVALMRHIATSPVLVQVAFVEIFAVGPAGIERRERLLGQFTDQLMRRLPQSRAPSRLAAEASVGAVWGIVHHHVTGGATHLLPGLADHATYIALAPVIGGEATVQVILAARKSPDP
ncbi:MAG: TetR/AcrR family transcriptional regulator [Solirubrobacteraceae bacterium]|jgi:AcrR family transcriptional regulator